MVTNQSISGVVDGDFYPVHITHIDASVAHHRELCSNVQGITV